MTDLPRSSLLASTAHCPPVLPEKAVRIHAILPQTQCQRCGYADCADYAQAVHAGQAAINQCPPGGVEGIARIAQALGQPELALGLEVDPQFGHEGPMTVAVIDEHWCIGCTLCLKACPTDAIAGSNKRMHTVMEALCTGCDLCVLACPVDCIEMQPISGERTGWAAWSPQQAQQALQRYQFHQFHIARAQQENDARLQAKAEEKLANLPQHSQHTDPAVLDKKRAIIAAALERARARQAAQKTQTGRKQ